MEAVTYIQFPKITATSAVTEVPPTPPPAPVVEYAYEIVLPAWGEFKVVKSANAWWMASQKVALLFDAYKSGATDESACINASISLGQLRYFRETHPDFSQAKEACKSAPLSKFLNALNTKGPEDLPTIRWFLSKRHPDFKSTQEKVDPTPVVQPTVNVAGDAQIIQNVDTTKIENILARAIEQFLTHAGRA